MLKKWRQTSEIVKSSQSLQRNLKNDKWDKGRIPSGYSYGANGKLNGEAQKAIKVKDNGIMDRHVNLHNRSNFHLCPFLVPEVRQLETIGKNLEHTLERIETTAETKMLGWILNKICQQKKNNELQLITKLRQFLK
ncbi:hypothetical protein LOAG_09169 [Loa loa]|uniref:Uncharacterized protein n=1 Tax=Loa loa TaxID=7209 RepID=A0A1S0TS67_LOALO|nr:hypothetical protein LOAG_09169 [Loa loa]EFO19325.1 hypothetical protein LOAG_09169 [Loa loa]